VYNELEGEYVIAESQGGGQNGEISYRDWFATG